MEPLTCKCVRFLQTDLYPGHQSTPLIPGLWCSLPVWLAQTPPQAQSLCFSDAQPPYPIPLWKADGLFCAVPHTQVTAAKHMPSMYWGRGRAGVQANDQKAHRPLWCGAWRLLQFFCLLGTWCAFWTSPRLAEWNRGSVWLPMEGGNLCALVCR